MPTIEEELQTVNIEDQHQRVFLNILFTAHYVQHKQKQVLEPFGVSGTQYNVLRILRGQCSHCMPTYSIKDRMIERNCDASRVVDRLVAVGLVIREACPNDKRSTLVKITQAGLDLLAEIDPVIDTAHSIKGITVSEAIELNRLLDKLRSDCPEVDQAGCMGQAFADTED
jgi:DNA-binding MarR family transcriptional regulator